MSMEIIGDSYVGYSEELAIFQKPIQNVGVKRSHLATFYPVNDYSNQGILQFSVTNNSSCYLDLRQTQLNITCKLVRHDGGTITPPTINIRGKNT